MIDIIYRYDIEIHLGLKKKLFVSCNPTLTSFYSKKSLP